MAKNNSTPKEVPVTPGQKDKPKTVSETLEEIGRKTLNQNPSLEAIYVTCDGYCFASKSDALNHAKDLNENTITLIKKTNTDE